MSLDGISFAWEQGFPKGYGHTSISYLKRCNGFESAKNGDIRAAFDVVEKCVKKDRLNKLREKYPDSILLPVINCNTLPLALAHSIGLPIWDKISIVHTVKRKPLYAIQRMMHKPAFTGYIQKDKTYIIVDDVVTQGGTIAALRKHVLACGGKVVAVVALAYSIGSYDIAPTEEQKIRLFSKFGEAVYWLEELGIIPSVEELTSSQVRYLLRFASIWNIFKKITEVDAKVSFF